MLPPGRFFGLSCRISKQDGPLTSTFADNLRFLRALVTRPKNMGALLPSSPILAKAIARQVHVHLGPVLEML